MLDLVLNGQDPNSDVPPTEVANQVYRLLVKREKQLAYQSLVSIQSEIYEMQGKSVERTLAPFLSHNNSKLEFRPRKWHIKQNVRKRKWNLLWTVEKCNNRRGSTRLYSWAKRDNREVWLGTRPRIS